METEFCADSQNVFLKALKTPTENSHLEMQKWFWCAFNIVCGYPL